MQAMILAAGLGTRLRPWTLSHPKALVKVGGVPMLQLVIERLKKQGFTNIVVNVHHFAQQIYDFLNSKDFGIDIAISDESDCLLDTGGAILHASSLFERQPILIHNVDILSNADLADLMHTHLEQGNDSTLLVSERVSSRKLIFDDCMKLRGWHNLKDGVYRPYGYRYDAKDCEYAFSGIHVVGEKVIEEMRRLERYPKFSIIEFLLSENNKCEIKGCLQEGLELIDIGKPDTLEKVNNI